MQFFIPHTKKAGFEASYIDIIAKLKDQLKVAISARKIFSISYVHDKKTCYAEVGQLERNGRYEILAIFEANPYIVFTKAKNGGQGLTILVSKEEITEIQDLIS